MNQRERGRPPRRQIFVVIAATLLALAVPTAAPLYADVYPSPNAETFAEALGKANLHFGFNANTITQYEPAVFSAAITYGTSIDPALPVIKVGQSNEATLTSSDADAFRIVPTSSSRQDLDSSGTLLPNGGFQIIWTWDVTPLKPGQQNLTLSIIPTVVVKGQVLPSTVESRNEPYSVTVQVNPAKRAFDDVVTAASSLQTHVPEQMTVGNQYDVSASLPLTGHVGTVQAGISLSTRSGSARVTIREASSSAGPQVRRASTNAPATRVTRRWTIVPDELGPILLVFTVAVDGKAGTQTLHQEVAANVSSRSVKPPPTFWETVLGGSDDVVKLLGVPAAIVTLVTGTITLLLLLKGRKRKQAEAEKGNGDNVQAVGDAGENGSS